MYIYLVLDKIKYIHIDCITSTKIEMHWMLKCLDKLVKVIGYQVQYCTTGSKHSFRCVAKKFI